MLIKEYIDSDTLKKEIFEDVLFFAVSGGGSMGVPGRIIVVNKKPAAFTMNYLYGDRRVDNRKVMEMFPAYEQCCFMGFGFEREVPKGWNHIDLGAGNSLFVADEVYEEFKRLTADFTEDYELYGAWQDAACRIVGLPDKDDTESE